MQVLGRGTHPDRERDAEPLSEWQNPALSALVVRRRPDHDDPPARIPLPGFLQQGHLFPAWDTPGGPEIQDHHRAAIFRQALFSATEVSQNEPVRSIRWRRLRDLRTNRPCQQAYKKYGPQRHRRPPQPFSVSMPFLDSTSRSGISRTPQGVPQRNHYYTTVAGTGTGDFSGDGGPATTPGKIVVLYGAGLGPPELIRNQARNGQFGTNHVDIPSIIISVWDSWTAQFFTFVRTTMALDGRPARIPGASRPAIHLTS